MLEEIEFVILEFYVLSCATVIILVSRWNLRDGIFLKYSQAILCLVKQIDKILFFKLEQLIKKDTCENFITVYGSANCN